MFRQLNCTKFWPNRSDAYPLWLDLLGAFGRMPQSQGIERQSARLVLPIGANSRFQAVSGP